MVDGAIDLADLQQVIAEFLARAGAEFGILFGSRARGDHLLGSDVDLVVVGRVFAGVAWLDRLSALHELWPPPLALEVLAYTPVEWRRRLPTSGVLQDALRDGIRIEPEKPRRAGPCTRREG